MLRYIAFSWNPRCERQLLWVKDQANRLLARTPSWKRVFNRNGLTVFCAGHNDSQRSLHQLPGAKGILLGRVFERGTDDFDCAQHKEAPESLAELDLSSPQGRYALTARYWGRYVALVALEPQNSRLAIRGPATGLPCYWALTRDGIAMFFSDAESYSAVPDFHFTVNWDYIRRRAVFGPSKTAETALSGVFEVQEGQGVEHSETGCHPTYIWNPFAVSLSKPLEDSEIAATALENTAIACAQSWSSGHSTVIHRLSGGLDSSVTLACLAASPAASRVICLNYHIPGIDTSDERVYARLAARAARCQLIERSRPREFRLESLMTIPFSVNPHPYVGNFETLSIERELALATGATAISSGDPGDILFCRFHLDLTLIDMVQRCGISRRAIRFAERIAQIEGISIWKGLRKALVYRPGRAGPLLLESTGAAIRPLVHPELRDQVPNLTRYEQHPLWPPPKEITPGKLLQIMTLMSFAAQYMPLGGRLDDPEELFPLFSQPLVEVCLRIPSYVHCLDGISRGLIRLAFAKRMPPQVLGRIWKGRPGRQAKDLILSHAPLLKELLLDGVLVKERILDRALLEDALAEHPTKNQCHSLHILEHLLTETWLMSCNNGSHSSSTATHPHAVSSQCM
jgi:asparagine synthase (glutamine-hydrolysing)